MHVRFLPRRSKFYWSLSLATTGIITVSLLSLQRWQERFHTTGGASTPAWSNALSPALQQYYAQNHYGPAPLLQVAMPVQLPQSNSLQRNPNQPSAPAAPAPLGRPAAPVFAPQPPTDDPFAPRNPQQVGNPVDDPFAPRNFPQLGPGNPPQQSDPFQLPSGQYSNPFETNRGAGDPFGFNTPRSVTLAHELRQVPADKRDQQRVSQLRAELAKEFDARHADQQQRLTQLLADAERIKQTLERRGEQRDEIIQRRLAELLGQPDELGWEYSLNAPLASNPGPTGPRPASRAPATPTAPAQVPNFPRASVQSTSESLRAERAERNAGGTQARSSQPSAGAINGLEPATISGPLAAVRVALIAGHRVMELREATVEAEGLSGKGLTSKAELARLRSQLRLAEAQWEQALESLRYEIELKKLAVESSQAELDAARQAIEIQSQSGSGSPQLSLQMKSREQMAQNALRKAELELEQALKQRALAEKIHQAPDDKQPADKQPADKQPADNKSVDVESANSSSTPNPSVSVPANAPHSTDGQPAAEGIPQSVDQPRENEQAPAPVAK